MMHSLCKSFEQNKAMRLLTNRSGKLVFPKPPSVTIMDLLRSWKSSATGCSTSGHSSY